MEKLDYKTIGERLKQAREEKRISLEEAGKNVGVNKTTIMRWENGQTEKFKISALETLANLYGVNSQWLTNDISTKYTYSNTADTSIISVPILGTVKAGYDYLATENCIGTVVVEKKIAENPEDLFALKVHGDSMSPTFIEDDIIVIKKQEDFKNGEIVIVLINGEEATIKKAYKTDSGIELKAINPYYPPRVFTKEEIKKIPIKIIGIVKQLKREF